MSCVRIVAVVQSCRRGQASFFGAPKCAELLFCTLLLMSHVEESYNGIEVAFPFETHT